MKPHPQQRATDAELIEALKTMSASQAAKHFGMNERTLYKRKAALARKGFSPEHGLREPYPDGFKMGKVTIQRNATGEIERTWERMCEDGDRQRELIQAAFDAMKDDLPKVDPVAAPGMTNDDLLAVYPLGDPHVGMLADNSETGGGHWDLKISERVHCAAMAALVDGAPAATNALIINCGDFYHSDNLEGRTARSGHNLDLDGRYSKMISVGVKVMRQCIDSALKKHKTVTIINSLGNHDDIGALWLTVTLSHAYENEPRVIINPSPSAFHYYEFGKVLIGVHHGHSCKADRLAGVMATDQAQAWGRTDRRYFYLGHIHHQTVKECAGVTLETFNTLAARDAWAASGGYRAQQNMKCIVHHKSHGEVMRFTVNAEMFK